jgi:hypothetical protein
VCSGVVFLDDRSFTYSGGAGHSKNSFFAILSQSQPAAVNSSGSPSSAGRTPSGM